MTEQGSPIVYDKNDMTSFTFDNAPDAVQLDHPFSKVFTHYPYRRGILLLLSF